MSSVPEELDVTSEANLLYIGLVSSTDEPDPDAPEHANVRTAFFGTYCWTYCICSSAYLSNNMSHQSSFSIAAPGQ